MLERATNHKPARQSRAIVSCLALGVAFLALWVFGSHIILKVARMIDAPVTTQVAMEVAIPAGMPASPRETPFPTIARTNLPSEPAIADSGGAEPVVSNSVAWRPAAPEPVATEPVEAIIAVNRFASSDRSMSLPPPVAPKPVTAEHPTPTPSRTVAAEDQAAPPSPTASVEAAPSEPLVPKPVGTIVAEGQTTTPPTAPVVVASAAASGAGVEPLWPNRLVARAFDAAIGERSRQSSVPLPSARPHIVSVPLPTPRPSTGTWQRASDRVLTEADVRLQELHF